MANEKELQIGIKTSADLSAIKQAETSVGQLAGAAAEAARATAQAGESAGTALNSLGETAAKAGSKSADASREAAKAANELGENFGKGAAAGRVLAEAARGNILALTQLGAAIKAIGALLKTNVVGVLVTVGAIAAQVILPMIQGFTETADKIGKTGSASDALKAKLAELEEAAKKSLQAQLAEVEKLNAGYADLLGRMDEAQGRAKELNQVRAELERAKIDRDEQVALRGAKTDEERTAIGNQFNQRRADFDAAQRSGTSAADAEFAKQRIKVAEQTLRDVQAVRDENARSVQKAQKEFDDAVQIASDLTKEAIRTSGVLGGKSVYGQIAQALPGASKLPGGFGSDLDELKSEDPEVLRMTERAKDAQRIAAEKKKSLDAAQEQASKAEEKLATSANRADAELRKFAATLEKINAQSETGAVQSQTASLKRENEQVREVERRAPRIAELKAAAQAAMERGDFAGQDRAVAELQRLEASTPAIPTVGRKADAPAAATEAGKVSDSTSAPAAKSASVAGSAQVPAGSPVSEAAPQTSAYAIPAPSGGPSGAMFEAPSDGRTELESFSRGFGEMQGGLGAAGAPGGPPVSLPRGGGEGGADGSSSQTNKILLEILEELKRQGKGGSGLSSATASISQRLSDQASKFTTTMSAVGQSVQQQDRAIDKLQRQVANNR